MIDNGQAGTWMRLRFKKAGWFILALDWVVGVKDIRTGIVSRHPCYPNADRAEMWVGPFASADAALNWNMGRRGVKCS